MSKQFTFLFWAFFVLSCSGHEQISTVVPELQEVIDSILTNHIPSKHTESVFCIILDQSGSVLARRSSMCDSISSSQRVLGSEYLIPNTLFRPVLVGTALIDGAISPQWLSKFSLEEAALLAERFGNPDIYNQCVKEWFPHSYDLIPVNTPLGKKAEYTQETLSGKTYLVPSIEVALFYNALAHGGVLATDAKYYLGEKVKQKRILSESFARVLLELLQVNTQQPCSSSFVGDLDFLVAGQAGTIELSSSNNEEGRFVSSFIGTFDHDNYGSVTLLISICFLSEDHYSPEFSAQSLFRQLAVEF